MKLADSLILSAGVALVIMGIYEIMVSGLLHSYTFLMPATALFLWFVYRKRRNA